MPDQGAASALSPAGPEAAARSPRAGACTAEVRGSNPLRSTRWSAQIDVISYRRTVAAQRGGQSVLAGAAKPGVRPQVAPDRNLGQPVEVMGPSFRMTGALLDSGQAGVGQAQQRPVRRLFDQVDLDQARPRRHSLAAVRRERYEVEGLIRRYGWDAKLTDLLPARCGLP
jgi:hypothetical protein